MEVNERVYTILRFTDSRGVCLPPEYTDGKNLKGRPVYAYGKENKLIYRPFLSNLPGEQYFSFYKPVFRGKNPTSVITIPPAYRPELTAGDKLICTWNDHAVHYRGIKSHDTIRPDFG